MRFLFVLLFCTPLLGFSQYISGFQQEYFFGRLPHARVEAMARAGVALDGSTANLFINPATIGVVQGWDAIVSTSAPFYVLKESDYYFVGATRRISPKWVVATSFHQFAIGPTTFDINIGGERYPTDSPATTNVAFSGAGEILPGLYAGVNVNFFRWKYIDEIAATHQVHADAGLLYRHNLPDSPKGKRYLQAGLSVTNVLNSKITFEGLQGETATNVFPMVLRVGATYVAHSSIDLPNAETGSIKYVITTEFQDVLNSSYRTAFKVGSEVLIWEVFALRLGTYTRSEDDLGNPVNKSRINDVTYGFGFKIPIEKLTKDKLPLNLAIDYTSLESPPVRAEGGSRLPNFRTFTFGFQWAIQ